MHALTDVIFFDVLWFCMQPGLHRPAMKCMGWYVNNLLEARAAWLTWDGGLAFLMRVCAFGGIAGPSF